MPIIKRYEIILKGDKENFMVVDQLEGQKLIMLLMKANRPEYVVIGGNCISLLMIAAIKRFKTSVYRDGIFHEYGENRELTDEEKRIEKMFDEIQGRKLMLN